MSATALLLTEHDFARAAAALACSVAAVKAVSEVEATSGGFDALGRPRILFEGHKFSQATQGRYDASHPSISHAKWTRRHYAVGPTPDARNAGEHSRLELASSLDRDAALASASWGKFQILGANHLACGFPTLQAFINAMYSSEGRHLDAFVGFVKSEGLAKHLQERRWALFARAYNGPDYAINRYDTKMADAYRRFST